MLSTSAVVKNDPTRRILRVSSVSFVNARPLISGLERADGLKLVLEVPSRLLEGLRAGRTDVALLPVIDYQRAEGLRIVPVGAIGSDGPTLTVRIFSRVPINQIKRLACDGDSHTSVALARIILAEQFGIRPELVDLTADATGEQAILLIGDKVVCEEPRGYEHGLDLGAAWKQLTGLPFVFAVWTARDDADLGDLPGRLEQARHRGTAQIEQIVAEHAVPRGWPADVARRYLSHHLQYHISDRHLEAIRRFHNLAARYGLIASPPKELRVY